MGFSEKLWLALTLGRNVIPWEQLIEVRKEASELIRIHPRDCFRSSVTTWWQVKLKIKLWT